MTIGQIRRKPVTRHIAPHSWRVTLADIKLGMNMSDSKNISPVGWYVGSYLIRFVELEAEDNHNLETKFLSWENTVIVQATNLDEAYDKIVAIAMESTTPYKGGPEGIPVQWIFEGVTELLPIYEAIEDGAEIMWAKHNPRKLKNLRKMVRKRDEFNQ